MEDEGLLRHHNFLQQTPESSFTRSGLEQPFKSKKSSEAILFSGLQKDSRIGVKEGNGGRWAKTVWIARGFTGRSKVAANSAMGTAHLRSCKRIKRCSSSLSRSGQHQPLQSTGVAQLGTYTAVAAAMAALHKPMQNLF